MTEQYSEAFEEWASEEGINNFHFNHCWAAWQAALASVSAEPTWQPIETAPTTGRTLLLGYPNRLGNWRTVRGQWMSEAYIAEYWEEPDDVEAGWFETSAEADDVPNCWRIEPTHWMRLPTPPTSQSCRSETCT